MFSWLRRIISGTKKFTMLRSVWFANLDCLVGITQYLQDDGNERKQSNIANQSDKSNESELSNKSASHNCAHHSPEPVIVQDMTALTTTTETPATSVATVQSTSTTASTTTSNSIGSSVTPSTTTTQATVKAPEAPKGKEIVPGFGIVMSMQLINSGYNLQQTQIQENIKLIQEQDYERQQNIFIEFISANDTGDYIIRASANRWRSILRDNPLQRFDLDD
jgi:hypothetical protein